MELNKMCLGCRYLHHGCIGSTEKAWTGCTYRKEGGYLAKARAVVKGPRTPHNGITILEKEGLRLVYFYEGSNVDSFLEIFDDHRGLIELGRSSAYNALGIARAMETFASTGRLN